MKFSIKISALKDFLERFINLYWRKLSSLSAVQFCWKGVIELLTFAVDPNVQQGNHFSFGFSEFSVDEQEKLEQGCLSSFQNSKKNYLQSLVYLVLLLPFFFIYYSSGKGLDIRFIGVGCGCGRQDIQVELVWWLGKFQLLLGWHVLSEWLSQGFSESEERLCLLFRKD